jgi:hypothetical protein
MCYQLLSQQLVEIVGLTELVADAYWFQIDESQQ